MTHFYFIGFHEYADGGFAFCRENGFLSISYVYVVDKALASDALQRYSNAILRKCNAIFYFKIKLFNVFDDVVFAGS